MVWMLQFRVYPPKYVYSLLQWNWFSEITMMHVTQVHRMITENQFHWTKLYYHRLTQQAYSAVPMSKLWTRGQNGVLKFELSLRECQSGMEYELTPLSDSFLLVINGKFLLRTKFIPQIIVYCCGIRAQSVAVAVPARMLDGSEGSGTNYTRLHTLFRRTTSVKLGVTMWKKCLLSGFRAKPHSV